MITRAAVGSTNPVKLAAARAVLTRALPGCTVTAVPAASGIPEQPWGDGETRRGAEARARQALAALGGAPDALGIGFEGGVVEEPGGLVRTCAWAAVAAPGGRVHVGGSMAMPLPPALVARLRAGDELGPAVDALVGTVDVKRGQGAVGVLTGGLVDRQRAYEVILAYALSPLLAPALWAREPGA